MIEQMINSDINSNGLENNVTGIATFHKQSPIATKKVALRDVNNNGRSLLPNVKETSLLLEGRTFTNATKVSGVKRTTLDHPSTQTASPSLTNNATFDHFTYIRRKLESEAGKERILGNTHTFTDLPSVINFPSMQHVFPPKQTRLNEKNMHYPPSVPSFLGKPGNSFSEAAQLGEQKRRERHNRLQDFIKYCDSESCQTEHAQRLQHLSPAELSRLAVELEKRAIRLTIEEGKEMQRMKNLNIIMGKSASTKAPMQTTQKHQPKN